MVDPTRFGSNEGYSWGSDSDDAAGLNNIEPHHDFCQLWQENYSLRVWYPGRQTMSTPGVYNNTPNGNNLAPALPVKATIHGIKGDAFFRFDGTDQGVGLWRDELGSIIDPQPSPFETYAALAGVPSLDNGTVYEQIQTGAYRDLNMAAHLPLFCCMYRGTFKQIDSNSGWEIDSGPADDPDTLLGVDITNPQVLESSRIDWWCMDMVRLPSMVRPLLNNVHPLVDHIHEKTYYPNAGSWHKFGLSLSENKVIGPDQVLWLHWKTGVIKLPVMLTVVGGGKAVSCAFYEGHKFSMSVQASMLVSTKVMT